MQSAEIETRVKSVITEVLKVKPEELSSAARFKEDLGADSLDRVSLLMALENEINAPISDEQAVQMATVGDAVALIQRLSTQEPAR
jgi:acyl carrier protein